MTGHVCDLCGVTLPSAAGLGTHRGWVHGPNAVALEDRFVRHIYFTSSCWLWTGSVNPNGYGAFGVRPNQPRYAHRVSYELFVGPIPEKLTIDHLCHDPLSCREGNVCPHRRCVRPEHLEAVTLRTNIRRARGLSDSEKDPDLKVVSS